MMETIVEQRLSIFVEDPAGPWHVVAQHAIVGDPLPAIEGLGVYAQPNPHVQDAGRWMLRGIASNERYATRDEKTRLVAAQEGLGRPESTRAVLIPIRKNAQWWALTQDERRAIFEARSSHISTGLRYLPAVARKLYHCRDLSDTEPFDFLTWFEFAPEDEPHFDNLLAELRASAEWDYVGREVEIRLTRR